MELDNSILDSALALFRHIQEKDVFEGYIKRFLVKRLLANKSLSCELEYRILERLKSECGQEFTKNLESIFGDIKFSNEFNGSFKKSERGTSRIPLSSMSFLKLVGQLYLHPTLCYHPR